MSERAIEPTVQAISQEVRNYEHGLNKGVCIGTDDNSVHVVGNVWSDDQGEVYAQTPVGDRHVVSAKVYQ